MFCKILGGKHCSNVKSPSLTNDRQKSVPVNVLTDILVRYPGMNVLRITPDFLDEASSERIHSRTSTRLATFETIYPTVPAAQDHELFISPGQRQWFLSNK